MGRLHLCPAHALQRRGHEPESKSETKGETESTCPVPDNSDKVGSESTRDGKCSDDIEAGINIPQEASDAR